MRALAVLVSLAAAPAAAQLDCTLQNDACFSDCAQMSVTFTIDASQFVAPQDPDDPPRRQITTVQMDDARFVAEAIMLPGDVVGFYENTAQLGTRLMIVQPDGSTRLIMQPQNQTWRGTCVRD